MKFWRSIVILGFTLNLLLTACFPMPNVTIEDDIKDENGNSIDKSSAPFKVTVNGAVSNAQGLYLYLVVDDGTAEYIQPGLGQNRDGPFKGDCYLGIIDDPKSLNKQYRIFAVVTDKEHKEYQPLDRGSVKAQSQKVIDVRRTH